VCWLKMRFKKKGDSAKQIEEASKAGKLVPGEVVVELLKKAMSKNKSNKFLVDGFPKNDENRNAWDKILGSSVALKGVLNFDCSYHTMEKRAKEAGFSNEKIKKNYEAYNGETKQILRYYDTVGKVIKINAELDVEAVHAYTKKLVEKMLAA